MSESVFLLLDIWFLELSCSRQILLNLYLDRGRGLTGMVHVAPGRGLTGMVHVAPWKIKGSN